VAAHDSAHRLGAHRATGLVVDATEADIGGALRRGHGSVVDETGREIAGRPACAEQEARGQWIKI
jgi:hypothetical protein